ncbi:exodeoxyribonuclease VII small subunit [Exiguobacterium mexicanum]
MAKQPAEQTFEAALARLEEIVTQLENGRSRP